jgi:hypothetical protein
MANEIYIAHLEDLLDEAKTNPTFNLAAELAALAAAIAEGIAK